MDISDEEVASKMRELKQQRKDKVKEMEKVA
jgi:hypothetical protein